MVMGVDWTDLALDSNKCHAAVNTATNLRATYIHILSGISQTVEKLLTNSAPTELE
jgi:hypothetical protein